MYGDERYRKSADSSCVAAPNVVRETQHDDLHFVRKVISISFRQDGLSSSTDEDIGHFPVSFFADGHIGACLVPHAPL